MWWFRISALISLVVYAAALTIPDWGRELARFAPLYALLIVAYLAAVWGGWRWVQDGRAAAGGAAYSVAEAPRAFSAGATPTVGASTGDAPAGDARFSPAAECRLLLWIWAVAVLYRALAVAAPPTLSDDLYRYLWDGRVLLEGINPYRYAPNAPELAYLRDGLWASINNPSLPTIYPPVLMAVFALVAWISPTLLAWKIAAALFDLGAGWFLMQALAARGRARLWVLIYLWHPLVVIEFAGNGHSDVVGLFFMCMGLAAWASGRHLRSGVALTLAGLVKFLPWVALPVLLPRLRWKWFLLPLVVALAYLPFQILSSLAPFQLGGVNALGSLGVFASKWRSNDFLFGFLVREGGSADDALRQAKLIVAVLVVLVWGAVIVSRRPLPSAFSWAVGAVLLLSPVVHPWYVLWLLPAAVLMRHPAWWVWSLTVFLAYAPLPEFRAGGVWTESTALKAVEYLPVLLLVPLQIWWGRRSAILRR